MKIKQQSKKKLKGNIRWHSLVLLDQIEHQQQYSNILVDRFLTDSNFSDADNRLLVRLVYGVTQRRYTLNYYLKPIIKGKKIEPWVETLLRLSIYQLVYLDRIPEHAVVNEAVNIAKINGHQALGNFVNALLRQFLRTPLPDLAAIPDTVERLSIQYSVEPWIVEELLSMKEQAEVEAMLESLLLDPIVSARINVPLEEREALLGELQAEGFEVEASQLSPYGIRCLKGNLIHSAAFKEGRLTIQDESSMLVSPIGKIKGSEQVLDACAAPGGKATHSASLLTDGHLTALDISAAKLNKVAQHAERMALTDRLTLQVSDATKFFPKPGTFYDIIYLDAPCSGLGLMRRKPEIKYQKTKADVAALAEIQLDLLNHLVTLLKPGGKLVYSTCTLTELENESLLDQFIASNDSIKLDPIQESEATSKDILTEKGQVRIWPHVYHTDGFFIARLIKQ